MLARGLYPIVDVDALATRGLAPLDFAERVLEAHPVVLQLRAKSLGARDTLALLCALVPLARRAGTLLFANDRPDLALLAEADGVHVGQDDLPLAEVRRLAPGLKVGVSTHDEAELRTALAAAPDYVAFGPVFATTSKARPEPSVGMQRLAAASASARAARVPLVAIGGIDRERLPLVAKHASLAAVIGALCPPGATLEEVAALARELAERFNASAA